MTMKQKDRATEALNTFLSAEFGTKMEPNYEKMVAVPIYYTQTLDGEHDIQFFADFGENTIYFTVDGERGLEKSYKDLDEMCSVIEECLTVDDLTSTADNYCFEHNICAYR